MVENTMMVLNGDHHPGDVVDHAHPDHMQAHPEHTILNGNHFHSPPPVTIAPIDPVMYLVLHITKALEGHFHVQFKFHIKMALQSLNCT